MPRKPFPCAVCGEPLNPGPRSAPQGEAAHARCRRRPSKHGTTTAYRRGCRCERCKEAQKLSMRKYVARRKKHGKPVDNSLASRRRIAAECEECSKEFLARTDKLNRFCSLKCANDFQGRSGRPRSAFKISRSVRLQIYADAGWVCQLCQCPTRSNEDSNHPRYPTLDHIVPRAHGGSDSLENLRLACRQCNITRGARVDWVPELMEVRDESVRQTA